MKKPERMEAFNMDSVDKRIIELKLKKGEMTDKFVDKYVTTLPDLSDQAEEVVVDMGRRRTTKS